MSHSLMTGIHPAQMERFDEIRPYHDHEVRPTLDRLLKDQQLLHALAHHQFPRMAGYLGGMIKWATGMGLKYKLRNIQDIEGLQQIIEPYLSDVIRSSTIGITFSGLDNLNKNKSYLYLSNHRDIVMDPACVNYGLFFNDMQTARIAIGDNLLQRPFVSDLMRLNKSFIVKRSVEGRREKLKSYQTLSAYIHHSIETHHSVWIAQSEGRAKDGNDQTDSAIIKMLHMSHRATESSFAEDIQSMSIVPVSISYEFDPCDQAKAKELYETEKHGSYEKSKNEDMLSIVTGIEGDKGNVHIHFGSPLTKTYDNPNQVVDEVNRQIHQNYKLHPSNLIAFDLIREEHPDIDVPSLSSLFKKFCPDDSPEDKLALKKSEFKQRLKQCEVAHHQKYLSMYAYPVINRYRNEG